MKFEDGKYILDEYDKKILKVLSDNARTTMSDLGEMIGKSRAAVYQRIKVMEEAGIITRYTVVIDWNIVNV